MPASPQKKMKTNKGGEEEGGVNNANLPNSIPQDLSNTVSSGSTVVLRRREESPSSQFLQTLGGNDQMTTVIQKKLVTPANYTPKKKKSGVPELQVDISKRYLIEEGCIASAVKKVWKGVGEAGPYQTMRSISTSRRNMGQENHFPSILVTTP